MNTHRTRRRTSPAGTRRPRSPRAARRARACHRDATAPASPCRRGVTVTAVTVAEARDRGAEAGAAARDGLVGLPPPRAKRGGGYAIGGRRRETRSMPGPLRNPNVRRIRSRKFAVAVLVVLVSGRPYTRDALLLPRPAAAGRPAPLPTFGQGKQKNGFSEQKRNTCRTHH